MREVTVAFSRRNRLPHGICVTIPHLTNRLRNILPETGPLVVIVVTTSPSMAACLRTLQRCHGKVTGTTQKLVSAVNHTPYGLRSVHSVQKPSARGFPIQSSLQLARPQLTRVNGLSPFRINKEAPGLATEASPRLLCVCSFLL